MSLFQSSPALSCAIGRLVHNSVRGDLVRATYHEAFIATRLLAGAAALAAFPLWLAVLGAPGLVGAIAFAWLLTPLVLALYVSRGGSLETAQSLSAVSLAGLVAFLAGATGGLASPLIAWLAVVPAEAAVSARRRVVAIAIIAAALALATLVALQATGAQPPPLTPTLPIWALPALAIVPAVLYAGALAAGAGSIGRRLADARQDAQALLAPLVEDAADMLTRHRRNGTVTYVSPACARILGTPPDELRGDGLFARLHVGDRPVYLKAIDEASGGAETVAELRLRRGGPEGGGYAWLEMRARPVARATRAEREVIAAFREIGARKMEESRRESEFAECERASLAKTQFLARVSHELRTPLNTIIGFSEMLSQGMVDEDDEERRREYAGLIRDSGRHLLDLINDILDMSKLETGNFHIVREAFDLRALIETSRQMLEPQARAGGLRVESDLPETLPELVADQRACKQMLLNLLQNAVKFTPAGGRIVVGAYVEGGHAAFYVADEGIGISAADVKRLGQPFLQLQTSYDRNYEGAGLGLSVVKGLVALHGGKLDIESAPGVGTRVTVRLPMEQAKSEPGTALPAPFRMTA